MSQDSRHELSLYNPIFYTVKTDLHTEEADLPTEGTCFFSFHCFPWFNTLQCVLEKAMD